MPEKLDFITPTVLKVIYLFHEHTRQEFHEREVMRRAKISKGSANSILRRLAQTEVLERRRAGRMVFYRLNTRSPIARQLKVLLNIYSLGGLLKGIRPYCSRILLFGSCAEGLDVRDSDIDLFVLTQEKEKVKLEISAHQRETGRRIAAVVVNANEFARMKREDRNLYDGIAKGIRLWESE